MIKTAKRWMTRRNEGGLMPLLFALCALFAVAPGHAATFDADAWRSLTPAHIAAFALLSAPDSETATAAVTPQRAALLLALWRQSAARTATPNPSSGEGFSAQSNSHEPLHSVALAHFAGEMGPLCPMWRPALHSFSPSVPTLMAHEAAFLSGVRTNRKLF